MIVATGVAFLMSRWCAARALFVLGFTSFYLFAWHFRVQGDPFAALNLGIWLNLGDILAITFLWVTWSEMTCRMRGIVDPSIPPLVNRRPHVA